MTHLSESAKRIFFGLSFCCFLFLISNCAKSQLSKSIEIRDAKDYVKIRVLTYNIQHGNTTSGTINLDLYAQIIKNQRPDIVALQEVDKGARRSGIVDQTAELAKRIGLKGYFGKYRDFQGGEYGDAILSRFPVLDVKVVPANSSLDKKHPRSYIFVKLKIAEDTFFYFNDSHLTPYAEEQKTIQAKELVDYWQEELNKQPLVIAGDLNALPSSNAMQVLLKHFNPSDPDFAPTFSARSSLKKKIDYILYPENENWKVLKSERICREDASDHCAVLAVLGFKKTN